MFYAPVHPRAPDRRGFGDQRFETLHYLTLGPISLLTDDAKDAHRCMAFIHNVHT